MTKQAATPEFYYMKLGDHSFTFGYMEVAFTMSEEALHKEMLQIGVDPESRVVGGGCQAQAMLTYPKKGKPLSVVALKPSFHKLLSHDIGVITHECVHVKQHLTEILSEEKISAEMEAYIIEAVTVFCVEHYLRARKRHDEMVVKQKPSRQKGGQG